MTGPVADRPQRVVVALGGNALLQRGEPLDAEHQMANVRRAARTIAGLVRDGHEVVVTHGNGPQVGMLALQAAAAQHDGGGFPLDVLGAETEGMIGYLLEQRLAAELPGRQVATLLTQVVVDSRDPAFAHPTKPIGPVYPTDEGHCRAAVEGWSMAADGTGVRRVVPSPAPQRIVELPSILALLDAHVVVLCAGGGGIPVVETPGDGRWGVEAVIDKDATAALLARELRADLLLVLTDVTAVQLGWGTPEARAIRQATPADLGRHTFHSGSMGPKVAAAARFVAQTAGRAAIGSIDDAAALVAGTAGTQVVFDGDLVLDRPASVAGPAVGRSARSPGPSPLGRDPS